MPNGRPLDGVCVLVTRARSQAAALVDLIEAQGGEVFAFPVLNIVDPESWEPLDEAIAHSARYRWVVITSPNGAEKFAARVAAAGKAPGDLAPLKVAAVGNTTAQALERLGFVVDLVPPEFRGAALPAALAPYLAPGDGVLMARANLADPALAENLRALGARVDDVVAYRTVSDAGDVAALKAKLAQQAIHYVTLTSSSSVANLLERLGGPQALARVRIAVIGPETKKAAEAVGLPVHVVAKQATTASLVNSMVEDRLQQLLP